MADPSNDATQMTTVKMIPPTMRPFTAIRTTTGRPGRSPASPSHFAQPPGWERRRRFVDVDIV